MISQITAVEFKPAIREISTAASVWPALTKTPPSRAIKGKTCPGVLISEGPELLSIATCIVLALSAAEIPVVTSFVDSIETVKAVSSLLVFLFSIGVNSNSSILFFVIDRQIRPRPYVAIKLIASGVAICAGIIRSPSFSLSSLSTRTYILPFLASSTISSMEDKKLFNLFISLKLFLFYIIFCSIYSITCNSINFYIY